MAALNNTGVTYRLAQTDVYIDDTVDVSFDASLLASSATGTAIQVYKTDNGNQRMNVTLTVNGNVLSIKGTPIFPVNSNFMVVIVKGASGLLGTGGEQLTANVTFTFRTGTKLKPDQAQTNPKDVISALDQVTDPAQKPVTYVTPDVSPQGTIEPFIPCEPTLPGTVPIGYVSGMISGITLGLTMLDSIPRAYEMGVIDTSNIVSIWDQDIQIVGSAPLKMTMQELQMGASPFAVSGVPMLSGPTVVQNELSAVFEQVATLNREFTVTIGAGTVKSIDGTKLNKLTKFKFTGPLDPMFCTFEMAVNNAGIWGVEFTDQDIYEYTMMIHRLSITAMELNGYKTMADVDELALNKMANFVCCSVALALLTYQNAGLGLDSAGAHGATVKKRQLPGVYIEYGASGSGTQGDPYSDSLKRLKDCIDKNKPGGLNDQLGWYGIATGIKSLRDPSYPLRRRN